MTPQQPRREGSVKCEIDYCEKPIHKTLIVTVEDEVEQIALPFCLLHLMRLESHLCTAIAQDVDLIDGDYSGPVAHINNAIEFMDAEAASQNERGN